MSQPTDDVVAFCRFFASFERDAICCGSVSVAQCVLLQFLRGGPQDVSSLADHLGVTAGAVTRMVDGLVAKAFVERSRDPQDRRRVEIGLTEAGGEEATRLYDLTDAAVHTILERIDAADRAAVAHALGLLRQAIDQPISPRPG